MHREITVILNTVLYQNYFSYTHHKCTVSQIVMDAQTSSIKYQKLFNNKIFNIINKYDKCGKHFRYVDDNTVCIIK